MRRIWQKIKEWAVWLLDDHVLDAINQGAPYEEIENYVKEKVRK